MESLHNENQMQSGTNELLSQSDDLKHYLYIIWQRQWLLWLCVLLAASSAFIFSWLQTPTYLATTTLLISEARTPDTNYQDLLLSERVASTYARWMTQRSVLDALAEKLDMTQDELELSLTDIAISPVARTQMLNVAVEGPNPEQLMTIANTLPVVFIETLNDTQSSRFAEAKASLEGQLAGLEQQIENQQTIIAAAETSEGAKNISESIRSDLALYQESYVRLRQSYETLRLTEINALDNIIVTQEAILPEDPIRPRIFNNIWISAIVGLLIALGAIFTMEYLDDRILSPVSLRRAVATPFLGAVSDFIDLDEKPTANGSRRQHLHLFQRRKHTPVNETPQLVTIHAPRHPIAEAYRGIRTNLRFANVDNPLQMLLVTSANQGEGKSTTSANLAVVMAQSGLSVILVDADLHKPRVHKIFSLPQTPGLTDVLVMGKRGTELSEDDVNHFLHATTLPKLQVLSSGQVPPNPSELLGSQRMEQLMAVLTQQADIVIFDAPPLLAVTDARVLGSRMQGVIMVIDSSQTQRNAVMQAVEDLKQVNATLVGAVLNRMDRSTRGYGYYYAYNSYYGDEDIQDVVQPSVPPNSRGVAAPAMIQEAQIASSQT